MSETDNDEIAKAECGNCRAVIPSDSTECPECNIKFSGMSEEDLGECGACGTLVPLESTSCSSCGVIFVADDVMDVLRKWLSNTGLNIKSLFDKFDTNGDGIIDSDELRKGLLSLNLADLPPSQVDRLIEQIDIDGDGKIDLAELEKSVTGSDYVASKDESEEDSGKEDEVEEDSDKEDEVEEESDEEKDSEEESDEEDSEDDDGSDEEKESEEESDEEDSDDDSDVEDSGEEGDESIEILPDDILKLMIDAMDRNDTNPATIFHALDEDGDKFISVEELSNTINDVLEGEEIAQESISDFVATLDADSDGNIDIIEFITAIENEIGLDSMDDEEEEKIPKEFPSAIQSSMMSKKWSDIWWPLIHAAFFIFILAWVVNGFIGPVDGSGGPVELDSHHQIGFEGFDEGDIYPCDSDEQADACANSLTPFSGENGASSMPKGFYTDGIIFILLGAIGMGGSMFTHLVLAKGWRARVKAMKEVEGDTEDAKEASESEDDEESDSDEEATDDEEAGDDEDQVEEESDDETEGDSEDDGGSDEDDDIDIGSHVGLTVEDEDFFGVIIEFDDEDGLVTIKEDGSGDEITGYQDEMFLE
jgi:Ca2+-binding EF-hand superfamily protein